MKRQLLAAGIVTALSATGLVGGAAIANAETNSSSTNPMTSLVGAIAEKFNLQESEVQSVFDEQRTAMQAEREADIKAEIARLVKEGKLTQAQADALNAKRAELSAERDANRAAYQALTSEERQAERDEHRVELRSWLEANDIDSDYAYLLMGKGGRVSHGSGSGGRGMMGFRNSTSSSTTDSTSN